ncbi:MAG: cobalamin-dependent protein, partial [Nanoarchaeota archaeon]|nr:cobalamin-dependent protein [Nanoarchaeota archaeon]
MKRILFVIPPLSSFKDFYSKNQTLRMTNSSIPYGVLSLIAYINKDKKNYEAQILDCNQATAIFFKKKVSVANFRINLINKIKSHILKFKPQYICISALFNTNFPHLKYISRAIKKCYPESILLLGGGLATNMYKTILKEMPYFDALCFGEGEIPLKKLLDNKNFLDISDISPAWITAKSIKNNITPASEFVKDLDEIPLLNFSLLNLKTYNNRSPMLVNTSYKQSSNKKIEMSIHTSRGCPFNCVFCSNGKIHGKTIRFMSISKVKKTIEQYISKYNMNVLLIEDDNFL